MVSTRRSPKSPNKPKSPKKSWTLSSATAVPHSTYIEVAAQILKQMNQNGQKKKQNQNRWVIRKDPNNIYLNRLSNWTFSNPPPKPKWKPVFLSTLPPGTGYSYQTNDGTWVHSVKR